LYARAGRKKLTKVLLWEGRIPASFAGHLSSFAEIKISFDTAPSTWVEFRRRRQLSQFLQFFQFLHLGRARTTRGEKASDSVRTLMLAVLACMVASFQGIRQGRHILNPPMLACPRFSTILCAGGKNINQISTTFSPFIYTWLVMLCAPFAGPATE
jgi:hypothetical protein